METRVLIRSNAVNPPPQWCSRWNLILIGQLASEIFMFKSVNARTDRLTDGRRLESRPKSSTRGFGLGELKNEIKAAKRTSYLFIHIRGLSQKVVDFSNSPKSWRVSMLILCRNIKLSIFNILSVLMTTKIKWNRFYGHSISVRYASPAHAKSERKKIVYFIFDRWLYWN